MGSVPRWGDLKGAGVWRGETSYFATRCAAGLHGVPRDGNGGGVCVLKHEYPNLLDSEDAHLLPPAIRMRRASICGRCTKKDR